jgi:thymidine kinase
MFSGKSDELIRRLNLAFIGKKKVICFKPSIDNRFSETKIVSRTGAEIDSISVPGGSVWSTHSVLMNTDWEQYDVIGFDEIQFFNPDVCVFIEKLAGAGKRVIVSGLDLDYNNVPFEITSLVAARAEFVDKLSAVCSVCGGLASRTFRKVDSKERVVVGDKIYEARCRKCYSEGMFEKV